ncbi:unnamed protein product [Candidula unifasciata]|uniref:G-protein coupled receptors family 1 profile domain-containing protein n=1 Tax=Candidula unifasciata TaxID=100452 RepID=A0A8S4A7H4_9EUPU|nr:unnamed protein product [Candidula unifasciata]
MNFSSSTVNNETDSCVLLSNFGSYIVYISVIISFLTICECLVVISVTCLTKNVHGNTNVYVVSLAVNDLLLAIAFIGNNVFLLPFHLPLFVNSKMLLCLISGLSSGTTNMSVVHLGVIAVDRYIQITYPFYYMKAMTKMRAYLVVLCLWLSCLIFIIIPPIVFYDDKYHRRCILIHQPFAYLIIQISSYFSSITLVFICYLKIAHVAFRHKRSTISRRFNSDVSQTDTSGTENIKAALRSVKFFLLMFGILFICTFPPYVATIFGLTYDISDNFFTGFFTLVPIHSVINFLIYSYMNKDFSASLVKIFKEIKRRCQDNRYV